MTTNLRDLIQPSIVGYTGSAGAGSFVSTSTISLIPISRYTISSSTIATTGTIAVISDSSTDGNASSAIDGIPAFFDGTNNRWVYFNNLGVVTTATAGIGVIPWSNVKQLNYFNNNTTDEKGNATITLGSLALSSSQSKFGGYSIYTGGGTGSWANSALTSIGTGDFCVEAFLYMTGGFSGNRAVFQFNASCIFGMNTSGIWRWDGTHFDSSTDTVSTNAWHHVAWYRISGVQYASFDGVVTTLRSSDTVSIGDPSAPIIGNDAYGDYWYGYIDSWRISNIGVYPTTDFTAPNVEFANS